MVKVVKEFLVWLLTEGLTKTEDGYVNLFPVVVKLVKELLVWHLVKDLTKLRMAMLTCFPASKDIRRSRVVVNSCVSQEKPD